MKMMQHNSETRESYHHGSLPDALVMEGAKLLAERGVEGFSLRQLARRTGVTVAAPSHHFGNAKGLLTAIAAEGFDRLAARMKEATVSAMGPEEAVISMCRAYLEMRVTDTGYAIVMFRLDLLDAADDRFRANAFHAFGLLEEALTKACPATVQPSQISVAAKALWATMHGLAALPMIEDREVNEILELSVAAHIAALK